LLIGICAKTSGLRQEQVFFLKYNCFIDKNEKISIHKIINLTRIFTFKFKKMAQARKIK